MNNSFDIYEMVTNLIVERLEAGVVPWHMPWKTATGLPQNMITKKAYRGFNFWYLLTVSANYGSPFFLSYKQVKSLGGHILKGEKGYPIIFWKMRDVQKKDGSIDQVPMLRYYKVFNIAQTAEVDKDRIPQLDEHDHDFNSIGEADRLVEFWADCPEIKLNQSQAFYSPGLDFVGMPSPRTFFKDEGYYSTLFHELIHSTGHRKRLGRHEKVSDHKFGSKDYSQEELVAEMGAAYMCGLLGIENSTIDNSAAYIKSWISKFKEDKKILLMASAQAQKAVDYILEHQVNPSVAASSAVAETEAEAA